MLHLRAIIMLLLCSDRAPTAALLLDRACQPPSREPARLQRQHSAVPIPSTRPQRIIMSGPKRGLVRSLYEGALDVVMGKQTVGKDAMGNVYLR